MSVTQSIAKAVNYTRLMDEVYKEGSKSAILDAANNAVRFVGSNKIEIFKTNMDGMGDYSKTNGFATAAVATSWEEKTLTRDRSWSVNIDNIDNEEDLGMPMATTLSEFVRCHETPEMDAYRFSVYATNAGTKAKADITIGTTDVANLLDVAEKEMNDAEVPVEGRICFISETAYAALKGKVNRYLANENGVNREVLTYNGMPLIRVPQNRFNTAITLNDGSSNFGYTVTAGGYKINFMIIHPSAVAQVVKHNPVRTFSPEQNQKADAYLVQTRLYHDAFVFDNKTKGIYVHTANTANA